jgi:hypothetical protein
MHLMIHLPCVLWHLSSKTRLLEEIRKMMAKTKGCLGLEFLVNCCIIDAKTNGGVMCGNFFILSMLQIAFIYAFILAR